ncbi:MAG: hypothetical protein L0H64_00620 [Pseudonocardia sp.]|nr:hypothetical protein [Pseudonocardia sp.]
MSLHPLSLLMHGRLVSDIARYHTDRLIAHMRVHQHIDARSGPPIQALDHAT